MTMEIPMLINTTSIYPELKPEIKFIELFQTEGGYIAGRYEIIFKV